MGPQRVQNPFCTNIVMLHIKSKVMISRTQLCKKFACLGVSRGQKVGFLVLLFLIVTPPLRLFELET